MGKKSSENDLLLFVNGGDCGGFGKRKVGIDWFEKEFKGTIVLILNNEHFVDGKWNLLSNKTTSMTNVHNASLVPKK